VANEEHLGDVLDAGKKRLVEDAWSAGWLWFGVFDRLLLVVVGQGAPPS